MTLFLLTSFYSEADTPSSSGNRCLHHIGVAALRAIGVYSRYRIEISLSGRNVAVCVDRRRLECGIDSSVARTGVHTPINVIPHNRRGTS